MGSDSAKSEQFLSGFHDFLRDFIERRIQREYKNLEKMSEFEHIHSTFPVVMDMRRAIVGKIAK